MLAASIAGFSDAGTAAARRRPAKDCDAVVRGRAEESREGCACALLPRNRRPIPLNPGSAPASALPPPPYPALKYCGEQNGAIAGKPLRFDHPLRLDALIVFAHLGMLRKPSVDVMEHRPHVRFRNGTFHDDHQ